MTVTAAQLEQEILQQIRANPGRDHEALEYVVTRPVQGGVQTIVPLPMALGALENLVARGELAKRSWGDGREVYGLPEAKVAA